MQVSIGIFCNSMQSLFLVFCLAEFNRLNGALKNNVVEALSFGLYLSILTCDYVINTRALLVPFHLVSLWCNTVVPWIWESFLGVTEYLRESLNILLGLLVSIMKRFKNKLKRSRTVSWELKKEEEEKQKKEK